MTNTEHQTELNKERFLLRLPETLQRETRCLRVAIYMRTAVSSSEQDSSIEHQTGMFMRLIGSIPNWKCAGIYKDRCSGLKTPMSRKAMREMIEDCQAGKIDLILTKSFSCFSRNLIDCISTIRMLKMLNPPVGVLFESQCFYSLDLNGNNLLEQLAVID